MKEFIENSIKNSKKNVNIENTFYCELDGFLYCNTCKKSKQTKINIGSQTHIVPCLCECEEIERERRKNIEKTRELIARIPKEYQNIRYENILNPNKIINEYITNFTQIFKPDGKGLFLQGDKGVGKTYCCCAIINELALQNQKIFAIPFVKLIRIFSSFNNYEEQESITNKIKHADLIFLDDFGSTRDSDFTTEKINEIIDLIYSNKTPLLLTTNLSREHLKRNRQEDVGRAYDRIIELTLPVTLENDSFRLQKAMMDREKYAKFYD